MKDFSLVNFYFYLLINLIFIPAFSIPAFSAEVSITKVEFNQQNRKELKNQKHKQQQQLNSNPSPKTHQFQRPVHTYSIVARDPNTGEMGVAVQSHWFAVGSLVAWGQAGVGVVATQSFIETKYGTTGLKLMEEGWSAPQALATLKQMDPHPEIRQVAILDNKGQVAAFTGDHCISHASNKQGLQYSVQANLMLHPGVPEAMEKAFLNSKGPLAERLLRALAAAQKTGGDLRGQQAAALLVVSGSRAPDQPLKGKLVDLQVLDHPNPLEELNRLYTLHKAYQHMNNGDAALEKNKVSEALKEYGKAEKLFPQNMEMKFWHAISLVNAKRLKESLPIFKQIFSVEPQWLELIPRLSAVEIIPKDPHIINEIQKVSGKSLRP